MSEAQEPPPAPRLPVYLDGELLEALAQTLDPSGVPGNRRVRFAEAGRTLEGDGYALKASGRIGSRLLGAQAGGERSRQSQGESTDDQSEEQEFIVREATLLWQAYSILKEEGHLQEASAQNIGEITPGNWVELRVKSVSRSLPSLSRFLVRLVRLQAEQVERQLERLREGESLLRTSKAPNTLKIGNLTLPEAKNAFLTDLVATLAAAGDQENLQGLAAVEGFADELLSAIVSDVRVEFLEPALAGWTALLTVRTETHDRLATAALQDAEFGVFGKVTLVRAEGEPISLARRTMLDWMDRSDLEALSSHMETLGADAFTVRPPLMQVLPLAIWV